MEVDWGVEGGGGAPHGEVFLAVVEGGAGFVIDEGADEAQVGDAAGEFVGAVGGGADGEDGEGCEACWVGFDGGGELVVGGDAVVDGERAGCVGDDL